jgi:P4 family phage/plasmid primase-like protien
MLSLINDQNREYETQHPLYDFYEEIKRIQDNICELNKDLAAKCKRNDKKGNYKGSCMSHFLQSLENKILDVMIEFCISKEIGLSAPCFDGFLAYKEDCDNYGLKNLLSDLEKCVFETLDIPIKLSEKSMNKDIIEFMSNIEESSSISSSTSSRMTEEGDEYFDDGLTSDYTLAKVILDVVYIKEIFYYNKVSNRCFIYDEKKALFVENKIEAVSSLFNDLIKPYYEKIDLYNTKGVKYDKSSNKKMYAARRYLDMSHGVRNVFNYFKLLLNAKDDSKFINETFDKNPDLFPFNDQVYDFKSNTYRRRTKNDFMTMTTYNDFMDDYDKDYVRQYIKDILNTDDEAYVDCFSLLIGYFLTGHNELKKFVMFSNPSGDNGKSVFLELLSRILDFYCIPTPDKVFISHKFDGSSSHQAHMFPLVGKRLVHMVEPDTKQKLNVDLIKKITGDDKIHNIRRCGGESNETVCIDCKLLMVCNEIPKFDGEKAFNNRILNIDFANKFPKSQSKKIEILDHKDDFFSYFCEFAHRFVHNNHTIDFVEQMISSSKKVIDENDTVFDFIENNYQITTNNKDRVRRTDLFEHYLSYCKKSEIENAISGRTKFYKAFNDRYNLRIYRNESFCCIKKIDSYNDDDDDVDDVDDEKCEMR